MKNKILDNVWVILRFVMSGILLWAFFDKVFGLGFSTNPDKSWLHGVSPTLGFLKFGAHGIFAYIFHAMAGNIIVDILFMCGLFFIGLALLSGIGMKIAGYAGALLMMLMYFAIVPSENNPLLDEHIVYALVFFGLSYSDAGKKWGLSEWWCKTKLVKKYPFLT